MNTQHTIESPTVTAAVPIRYSVTDKDIDELRTKYGGVTFATKEGYETGRLGIARCREHMVAIEKARAEWVKESRRREKMVNQEADRVTAPIEDIRADLQRKKDLVDQERERERRAKEDAKRMAFDAEARREREAEQARLKAENDRLVEESRKILAEKEKARAEADRLAKEREALEAEKARVAAKSQNQTAIDPPDRAFFSPEDRRWDIHRPMVSSHTTAAATDADRVRDWSVLIRDVIGAAPVCTDTKIRLAVLQAVDELTAVALTLESLT